MKKLAVITTHPIQYNAPLFKLLTLRKNLQVKVFYTWGQAHDKVFDTGFSIYRTWDIPLLEGYEYEFVENVAAKPGSHHFNGIINPLLIKKVEAYKPDAALVIGWCFNSHLKLLRYLKGKCKVLFRGDSTLLNEPAGTSLKKIARRFFLRWVYSHIDIALYTGIANKAYFEAAKLKCWQMYFAPHAVDNTRFEGKGYEYESIALQWRKNIGIDEACRVFLFAGKFELKKNVALLINAFIKTASQKDHLILVGNGLLENDLKALASGNPRIHFLNFQNQSIMPVVYRLCDVFVLPSQGPGETWGLAVNEAMACARPVLVSDKCGCAADLVKDGVNGYVFKSNDINDLISKINLLTKDKLSQLGKQSLRIIQQWTHQKACEQIEELI